MKIGIVGAGAVGSACLLSVVMRASAREVVLVNRNRKKAQGVVTDIQYGATLFPPIDVREGDYSDLAGASVVMITAGVNEKGGGATDRSDPAGRLRLLEANTAVFQEIVPKIRNAAPDTMILVVTDPPDALADVLRRLGHDRVLSTGTSLDTLRFSLHLARRLKVGATDVDAFVLGEHGTSSALRKVSVRSAWLTRGLDGPVPAPVDLMARAISSRSAAVRSRLAASIQPSTCSGERAPTIAPVTPGQLSVQAIATDETDVPCRCAMGFRASRSATLRSRLGELNSGDRRRQSSFAMCETLWALNRSVSNPDCIGL